MPNIKTAKRAVAVKVCRILHENGELNDNLMPISKRKCIDNNRDIYLRHWREFPDGEFETFLAFGIPFLRPILFLNLQIIPSWQEQRKIIASMTFISHTVLWAVLQNKASIVCSTSYRLHQTSFQIVMMQMNKFSMIYMEEHVHLAY